MLIMPLEKGIDWSRPPWVTFLLIISCSFVLFFLQSQDMKRFEESFSFYFSSPLPKLELPAYATEKGHDAAVVQGLEHLLSLKYETLKEEEQLQLIYFLIEMERDEEFFQRLQNHEIITAENPDFELWKSQRGQYEALQNATFMARYAFTPAKHEPVTFLTHAFMHGDIGHLVGNMVFLFLVGCAVETALGSLLYMFCYLLMALGSVTVFWLCYPSSMIPLVGASGAISGVMGLYAGIFGLRKIRVFYSVLFYFDYIKVPALTMLPLWIVYEFYQLVTTPGSNVAFMAHVGGFVTGGALSLLLNYGLKSKIDVEYLDASSKEESKKERFQQALNLLGELNVASATLLLKELHEEYPQDREILWQLYKALSYKPDSHEFHQMVGKILGLHDNDPQTLKMMNEAFQHYRKAGAGKIKLPSETFFRLIIKFAKGGYPADAECLALNFLQKKPDTPELDNALLAVANSWRQKHDYQRYNGCIELLHKHFPGKQV